MKLLVLAMTMRLVLGKDYNLIDTKRPKKFTCHFQRR